MATVQMKSPTVWQDWIEGAEEVVRQRADQQLQDAAARYIRIHDDHLDAVAEEAISREWLAYISVDRIALIVEHNSIARQLKREYRQAVREIRRAAKRDKALDVTFMIRREEQKFADEVGEIRRLCEVFREEIEEARVEYAATKYWLQEAEDALLERFEVHQEAKQLFAEVYRLPPEPTTS